MKVNKTLPLENNEKLWFFLALNIIFQFFLIHKFENSYIFLIPWIFFIFVVKLTFKQVIIGTLIPTCLVFCMYVISNKDTNLLLHFNKLWNLNKLSTEYIDQKYEKNLSEFINLLIFNFNKNKSHIYQEFSNFGISYILVISGFHMSFLQKMLSFLLNTLGNIKCLKINNNIWRKIVNLIVFSILFTYWWSMGFIISGFRVVINMLLKTKNPIVAWSQTIIITFILFPYSVISYSFILSFFIPLLFMLINTHDNSNTIKNIYKHLSALVFSHILLFPFSKKLYFLSYINFVIFYPVIIFLFVYYLLFFLMWFIGNIALIFLQ